MTVRFTYLNAFFNGNGISVLEHRTIVKQYPKSNVHAEVVKQALHLGIDREDGARILPSALILSEIVPHG